MKPFRRQTRHQHAARMPAVRNGNAKLTGLYFGDHQGTSVAVGEQQGAMRRLCQVGAKGFENQFGPGCGLVDK